MASMAHKPTLSISEAAASCLGLFQELPAIPDGKAQLQFQR
jgi:hypothetical protein